MTADQPTPAIELRGVSVNLGGHQALDAVDLLVPAHDFLAVIGPNGGGKTTLLRVILGLARPDRGTVRVLGRSPGAVRGRLAYVPQYAQFDPTFPIRVQDMVEMGRLRGDRLLRPVRRVDRSIAGEALERVDMAALAGRMVGRLSGGQLQRVLIARALAVRAEILVLDEPTASLDVQSADSFYKLLSGLTSQMTVVLTSHDIGSVSTHVKNMACLNSRLYSHALGELTPAKVAEIYGCPIELVAHGVPHRVLSPHEGAGKGEPHAHDHGGPGGHAHADHRSARTGDGRPASEGDPA